MAKFGEHFLEFKNTPNFKQIPVTKIDDQWYITTGKNSVTKVQDSKSVYTWTLQQGHMHYFTTPVAYFKGNLYSVMDKFVLLKWSDEDINLENAEKVQFQEEVHHIVHLSGAEPFIVFQSGKFLIIDADSFCHLNPPELIKLRNGDRLEWVDAAMSTTSIEVLYLTFNNKTKQKTLYYFSVNKEDKTISALSTFHIFHESASFKTCCLNHQDLSFFFLWSDGTLQCYNVKDSSIKIILSLEGVSMDTIIDIYCIDSKHIVTAKGEPKSKECVLEIWDIQAMLRGSRKVETPELISFQISATNSYIFLNFPSDKLIAMPYYMDSSFVSTINTSDPKQFQQLLWKSDLKVEQVPVENESMDISFLDQSPLDSLELLAEKLLNQDSSDLKFISESELIKILQLLIRHKKNNPDDSTKDMYNLLNMIFSASFNDALLMKHLKLLNVEDILVALDILLKYMKHPVNGPSGVLEKPSDIQIVNWICLVICSHTETLLFTKDKTAKKLLKDLKKTLSLKMKEFEDLEGLQSYLSVLQKKDILPQECSVEKYCLETLDI